MTGWLQGHVGGPTERTMQTSAAEYEAPEQNREPVCVCVCVCVSVSPLSLSLSLSPRLSLPAYLSFTGRATWQQPPCNRV